MKNLTKEQQIRVSELTEKYGIDEYNSGFEKDNDGTVFYYFKSAFGNGYACIQKNGAIEAGNLGYFEKL